MIRRICNLSKNNSFFLFGARGTGKSTLLQDQFSQSFIPSKLMWVDLLLPETEQQLTLNPGRLLDQVSARSEKPEFIIIDEVQKIPKLLEVVHLGIQRHKLRFALTGSSARKLKRGQANLLAGRAFVFNLYPLTFTELGSQFKLDDVLHWGTLPGLLDLSTDTDRRRFLFAYSQTYIREEILAEQIVRNIEPFRYFLEVAAQSNGQIINYSRIAREAGIDPKSSERYFEVLSDTLLGHLLPAHDRSVRRQQATKPKFYLFDLGVARALSNTIDVILSPGTYGYGNAFEHMIILEAIRLNHYTEAHYRMSYLRTKDDVEIDLVLTKGRQVKLVEIKSSTKITTDDTKALRNLGREFKGATKYLLCQTPVAYVEDDIQVMPWQDGLRNIFAL